MTLDEAIKHAEEVANTNERLCETVHPAMQLSDYGKCAKEHRQLAEWLKELVKYRQTFGHIEQRAAGVVIYKGQVFKTFDDDLVLKTKDKNGYCSFYGFKEVDC